MNEPPSDLQAPPVDSTAADTSSEPSPASDFGAAVTMEPLDFSALRDIFGAAHIQKGVPDIRAQLAQWFEESEERDRKRESADLALRGFFTQELEKLRSAIQVELRIRAAQQILRDLLPVLNDLDEEIHTVECLPPEETARLLRPLQSTRRRIYAALRKLGLEQIPVTEGETEYNPELHECAGTVEVETSAGTTGRIVSLKRQGYFFRGELYQASLVVIAGEK
jgi:molecular chaperone GrpE (heat shock protein)